MGGGCLATVNVYKGKRKTTYQLTLYKGYMVKDGKRKQVKDTVTYTLEEMGIDPLSKNGNPRAESTILKQVQFYADNLEKRLAGANYTKGDKVSFADFYTETWKPWAENHFAASTYDSYTLHIDEIFMPRLGTIKIGKITPERLSAIYLDLAKGGRLDGKEGGYAKLSILAFHKHIQSVMQLATKYRVIEENPCLNVEFPKVNETERVKYLTQEQTNLFLEMLENPSPCIVTAYYENWGKSKTTVYDFCAREMTRLQYNTYKTLFRVALFSGCRVGELCALNWNDIDMDTGTIHVYKSVAYAKSRGGTYIKEPKTRSSYREVVIPQSEILRLKILKKEQHEAILRMGTAWEGDRVNLDENLIFPQYCGKLMWKAAANRILRRLINNYNVQAPEDKQLPLITIHCLRHTCATLLIAGDMDVKTISARLGHKNIQTTLNIYAHPLKERDEQASVVLDSMLNSKQNVG